MDFIWTVPTLDMEAMGLRIMMGALDSTRLKMI